MTDVQESTPAKAKKIPTCAKWYVDAAGEESRHVSPGTVEVQFRFTDDKKTVRKYRLPDFSDGMKNALFFHGVGQKGGDPYAGKNDQEAIDAHDATMDVISGENGEWVRKGEGVGVPSTILYEVFSIHLRNTGKKDPDTEEGRKKIAAYVKGLSKDQRKALLAKPDMAICHSEFKQKREAARLKALKATAKDVKAEDLGAGFN